MIPVPFPCKPGDKLRVTVNAPYGTQLAVGDLVTVIEPGVWVERGRPMPVVKVSTAHGPQTLGFDAVEPFTPPTYTAAEPDDVVDEFFLGIVNADPELEALVVQMDADLAAVEEAEQLAAEEPDEESMQRRPVGSPYLVKDYDGDELEVLYFEQDHPRKGRQGGFHFIINEEDAVIIPADSIGGLIRFLITRRSHSMRPEE